MKSSFEDEDRTMRTPKVAADALQCTRMIQPLPRLSSSASSVRRIPTDPRKVRRMLSCWPTSSSPRSSAVRSRSSVIPTRMCYAGSNFLHLRGACDRAALRSGASPAMVMSHKGFGRVLLATGRVGRSVEGPARPALVRRRHTWQTRRDGCATGRRCDSGH